MLTLSWPDAEDTVRRRNPQRIHKNIQFATQGSANVSTALGYGSVEAQKAVISNYKKYLETGLYETLQESRQLAEQSRMAEDNWRASAARLKIAAREEARDRETFRAIHSLAMDAKRRLGEYESEFFSSDDEAEDWFRRH